MIKLLLVEDQDIFRQGLATLLSVEDDLELVGEASNGRIAIALCEELQPDVILMDVRMPVCDGVVATREIHQRYPWIGILVLTTFDDDEYIWQSLQAGAVSYLLKSTPSEQVAAAVRAAYLGYSQLDSAIASRVFSHLKPHASNLESDYQNLLSPREIEVLKLVGKGMNNQEIALSLHLTEGTVKNYITRILSQLNFRDRVSAALWAQKNLLN
jgi:DNA-binding NarL/FixJ family response regulator